MPLHPLPRQVLELVHRPHGRAGGYTNLLYNLVAAPPSPPPPHAPCVARLSTADGTFEALASVASGKGRSFTYNSNVKGPGEDKGGWRQASGSADSWKCPVDTAGTRT